MGLVYIEYKSSGKHLMWGIAVATVMLTLKYDVITVSHLKSDCGNIISSSKQLQTNSCSAFDRTGCSQLSQKVVQSSSFPITIEKLIVFWQKMF